jgi:uncharacterized protein
MQGSAKGLTAADIIRLLDLTPHPEGGHFCQTFRDPVDRGGRAASTAIYFLLARGERSHWHRVDAAEAWHYYAGARSSSRFQTAAAPVSSGSASAPIFRPASGRRRSSRLMRGRPPRASATGRWSDAPSPRASCIRASSWRRRDGRRRAQPALRNPIESRGEASRLHTMICPPLADKVEPVMRPASSAARNSTQRATSSGSPSRPIGISGRIDFSRTSFGTACTISVLI